MLVLCMLARCWFGNSSEVLEVAGSEVLLSMSVVGCVGAV